MVAVMMEVVRMGIGFAVGSNGTGGLLFVAVGWCRARVFTLSLNRTAGSQWESVSVLSVWSVPSNDKTEHGRDLNSDQVGLRGLHFLPPFLAWAPLPLFPAASVSWVGAAAVPRSVNLEGPASTRPQRWEVYLDSLGGPYQARNEQRDGCCCRGL